MNVLYRSMKKYSSVKGMGASPDFCCKTGTFIKLFVYTRSLYILKEFEADGLIKLLRVLIL